MTHSPSVSDGPVAVPMWIPTPGGHVFAWYHPPAARETRRCAVLLCDSFGWNRMVLHLTYRHLALRLAEAGFPVLRVDYPGTCDSEGSPRKSARVETWLSSLGVAADRLKEWSGARELALCGAMLGGTLGVLLAARRTDIAALALWGPYLDGRAWVRAGIAAAATTSSNPQGRKPSTAMEGDREALGFLLTQDLIADVSSIDLLRIPPSTVRSVLILPRTETSSEPKLARHFSSAGIAVDLREKASDELDDVLESEGVGNPRQTIEDIAAWFVREYPHLDAARPVDPALFCPSEVLLREAGNAHVRESAVYVGSEGTLFGILSEPVDREPSALAVVLVTGGANHRPGINRNYTEWARALAARGHRVLRIDVRGLGDSPPSEPGLIGVLYRDEARQDVLDAVYWLKARGSGSVACVGLCAGGYQAFHAALTDPSITSVVMLNPLRFHEQPFEDPGGDLLAADRWRQAIQGDLDARELVRRALRFARRIVSRFLPWASNEGRAARRIARSFVELTSRGVDVCIVYNENDRRLGFLRHTLRPVRRRLESAGRFRIETVGHSDHIYSPLWVQQQVAEVLLRYFGELSERTPADVPAPAALATGPLRAGAKLPQGDAR